jgi:hydroxymethylbilane synthase
MKNKIIIGSRGSDLALWQANYVKTQLEKKEIEVEIKIIKTKGDIVQDLSFDKIEGKGFFTKEIEEALLNQEIDLAVHSHKDLPTESPEGLTIAAVSYREDPSELLLIRKTEVDESQILELKPNAIVGTSASRRKAQLLLFRKDIAIKDLRGNVPTRINKLRNGDYDAIMIASAGVERLELDLSDLHVLKLDPKEFIPAPSQGVLALQTRSEDDALISTLEGVFKNDDIKEYVTVERQLLNLFGGGCHTPIGAYCYSEETDDERTLYHYFGSYAKEATQESKQVYIKGYDLFNLPEKAYEQLHKRTAKKIFITRDKKAQDLFVNHLSNFNHQISCQSLIEFNTIRIGFLKKSDWIFFASKHAVRYFFIQKPELRGHEKYGVVGKATADELRKHGKRADFIGTSNDTKLIGKQFAARVGSQSVLFPKAKDSLNTIQYQFAKKENLMDLNVYETKKIPLSENPNADILVFTSPSNVEAYFSDYQYVNGQKIVAMGEATASAIEKLKIKVNASPATFSDIGLIQAVQSVL